jgi:transketolase
MNNTDVSENRIKSLEVMANRLRRHSLISTAEAKSGHPSTCLSCAEIVSTLFFQFYKFDLENPDCPANDRFVLSKGHAAPILWSALGEAGAFPIEELLNLRKIDSELEGHPTPRSPYVDVTTGSLGQGLANAVGMAFTSRLNQVDNQIYVLLGDGEIAEGSVWEAASLASHYQLSNMVAIVDVNRLGQSEPTMTGHNIGVYGDRFKAFGWDVKIIDGHDIKELIAALDFAVNNKNKPTAILAKTFKGKGVSFMEDADGWHGRPVTDPEQLKQALAEVGGEENTPEKLILAKPERKSAAPSAPAGTAIKCDYSPDDKVATRQAYGKGLAKLGYLDKRIVALDGDCKNSTFSDLFRKEHPDRFFECFIAEQVLVGAASGLASQGKIPFASTFACFLTRAYDFIRIAGISGLNLKLCGSHAGVSIGEDGPSQMALEDLAMMRAVGGSTVLYPSDGVSAEKLVAEAARTEGITYIRSSRPATKILYSNDEEFPIGGSKIIRSSNSDKATLVSAGVTLHEAIKAADILAESGISVRVIDLYSIKPIDSLGLQKAARDTGLVVTIEDHYPEGGIGEAVQSALANVPCKVSCLAVRGIPRSGSSSELLNLFGIDAEGIVKTVRESL